MTKVNVCVVYMVSIVLCSRSLTCLLLEFAQFHIPRHFTVCEYACRMLFCLLRCKTLTLAFMLPMQHLERSMLME